MPPSLFNIRHKKILKKCYRGILPVEILIQKFQRSSLCKGHVVLDLHDIVKDRQK